MAGLVCLLAVLATAPTAEKEGAQSAPAAAKPETAPAPGPEKRIQILVLEPKPLDGRDKDAAQLVGSLVAADLGEVELFAVTTSADLARMVEIEAERQAMGCDTDSCLAEVAGAMGADLVVYGELGSLGKTKVLTLNLFESKAARGVGRTSLRAGATDEIADGLRPAVAKLVEPYLRSRGKTLPPGYAEGSAAVVVNQPESGGLGFTWGAVVGGTGVGMLLIGVLVGSVGGVVGYQLASGAAMRSFQVTSAEDYDAANADYLLGSIIYLGSLLGGSVLAVFGAVAGLAGAGLLGYAAVGGEE